MIRRHFIKLATLTGATGIATLGVVQAFRGDPAEAAGEVQSVRWHVRGFTCITCAVGLETLLRREKGVIAAHATYPEGLVTIQYRPDLISEKRLRAAIAELGFTAEAAKG